MSSRQLRLEIPTPQPPSPAALDEPLLAPDDVAGLFGVKRSTIYELARNGQLPAVKIGRAIRFLRADLEAWLDDQRAQRSRHP